MDAARAPREPAPRPLPAVLRGPIRTPGRRGCRELRASPVIAADVNALTRQGRTRLPEAHRGHSHRPLQGPSRANDRQRGSLGPSSRSGVFIALGGAPLARLLAGAPSRALRAPRCGAGAGETRTWPPGQASRDREPHRPSGRSAASPGANQETPQRKDRTKETRRPTRHTAATRQQDRQASQDHGGQPGDRRPFAAARRADTHYRSVLRNGVTVLVRDNFVLSPGREGT